jgi:hypothetical protein
VRAEVCLLIHIEGALVTAVETTKLCDLIQEGALVKTESPRPMLERTESYRRMESWHHLFLIFVTKFCVAHVKTIFHCRFLVMKLGNILVSSCLGPWASCGP